VEQLQNAGPVAGQQPGQVKAPEASIGPRGVGGSSSSASSNSQSGSPAAQSSNPAAQSGNTSGQGGASQDVVIAPKGQTFQSILGLK
jgi:hypothetical protein